MNIFPKDSIPAKMLADLKNLIKRNAKFDKKTLLGLIPISSVLHYIDHRLQVGFGVFGVGCLFGIFGIVDWVVEPATHIPYLADRHYDDLRGSRYLLRMSI